MNLLLTKAKWLIICLAVREGYRLDKFTQEDIEQLAKALK